MTGKEERNEMDREAEELATRTPGYGVWTQTGRDKMHYEQDKEGKHSLLGRTVVAVILDAQGKVETIGLDDNTAIGARLTDESRYGSCGCWAELDIEKVKGDGR